MSLYKELRELCDDKLKFKDFKKTIKNILKDITDDKFREEAKQGNEKLGEIDKREDGRPVIGYDSENNTVLGFDPSGLPIIDYHKDD